MSNHAEMLLSTVQNLRGYLVGHPHARGDIATIRYTWLPGELFPPEERMVQQAVNVLVNSGELVGVTEADTRVYCAKDPLDQVAGY